MLLVNLYDPAARRREKQISREQDDRDVRSGAVSRADLRGRNSIFASLDLSRSSIRRRSRAV